MYVAKVGLSNIRGFTGVRTVDLTLPPGGGWTVIAGSNGSGKTTLLRALAIALSGPTVAHSLMADFGSWVSSGAESGGVEIHITPDYSLDAFTGRGRSPAGNLVLGLTWAVPRSGPERPGTSPQPEMTAHGDQNAERGPWATNPQGWFCAAYGPFRRLVGGSGEGQRLMLAPGPAGRMASLFHEDASLAEGVSWLIDLHLRRLEERPGAAELLETVEDLISDGLLPGGYRVDRVNADGLWVTRDVGDDGVPQSFPLREMSDGYRTMAALVLDIVRQIQAAYGALDAVATDDGHHEVRMPGVVLIDEIDAHLHVTWQQRISNWLRQHFPHVQFIVTSHSPYVCQAADPGGLILLPAPDEERAPYVADEDLYRRIVYGSGDDAAVSELFGLETPYSREAEEKRRRLVQLERKVFAGQADEAEITEYRELTHVLTSSLGARVTEVAARLGGRR